MSSNSGQTGSQAASAAAKTLNDSGSSQEEKSAAASALSQTPSDSGKK